MGTSRFHRSLESEPRELQFFAHLMWKNTNNGEGGGVAPFPFFELSSPQWSSWWSFIASLRKGRAARGESRSSRRPSLRGLKPIASYRPFTARLKPCPFKTRLPPQTVRVVSPIRQTSSADERTISRCPVVSAIVPLAPVRVGAILLEVEWGYHRRLAAELATCAA